MFKIIDRRAHHLPARHVPGDMAVDAVPRQRRPGLGLSYWGTLPLGILVSVLLGGATAPAVVVR